MKIKNLTEDQNNKLAELLSELCAGHYWQVEGWTSEHSNWFDKAEVELEQFLNQVTSELARGGEQQIQL